LLFIEFGDCLLDTLSMDAYNFIYSFLQGLTKNDFLEIWLGGGGNFQSFSLRIQGHRSRYGQYGRSRTTSFSG